QAAAGEPQAKQEFIQDPERYAQIEFYTLKPEGSGPFPVMFMLHGSQAPEENVGGRQYVDLHWMENFTKMGIMAVSISQPGFGHSEGSRDWCGPASQTAVAT